MCLEIKKFAKEKTSIIVFSVFLVLCWSAALIYQHRSERIMQRDMNSILERYDKILAIDGGESIEVDVKAINQLCEDLRLSPTQRVSLQSFVNTSIQHAVSLSHVDLEKNAIVAAKADAMFNETRDILDSQFLKIQHETESLQIWCSLITVVFLVFSFFSLFQSSEFVRKGEEGVAELKNLKSQAEATVQDMQQRSADALNQMNQFSQEKTKILSQIQTDANNLSEKVQTSMDNANRLMQTMKDEVEKSKDVSAGLSKDFKEQVESTTDNLTTLVNKEKKRIEEKEKELEQSWNDWVKRKEDEIDSSTRELLGNLGLVGNTLESQLAVVDAKIDQLEEMVKILTKKEE